MYTSCHSQRQQLVTFQSLVKENQANDKQLHEMLILLNEGFFQNVSVLL